MATVRETNGARGRTASEAIAEQIRSQIATEVLRPGDALPPEDSLRDVYGVARPTVREALRILESDGLVTVRRGVNGGARVREPDVTTLARRAGLHLQLRGTQLADLIEAQQVMQPGAVALAARRRTEAQLAALERCVDAIETCRTIEEYADLAADFLRMLLQASGNQSLSLFSELIDALLHEKLRAHMSDMSQDEMHDFLAWCSEQYRQIVTLIAAGDADGAEAFWREHLKVARPLTALDATPEGAPLEVYRPWRRGPNATAPQLGATDRRGRRSG